MNKILEIRKKLSSSPNKGGGGFNTIPKGYSLSSDKVRKLWEDLKSVLGYWEKRKEINGALVSVHYSRIMPKSKRLSRILKDKTICPNQSICGAKYAYKSGDSRYHVITHFVSLEALKNSMKELSFVADFIDKEYEGKISCSGQENLANRMPKNCELSKSAISNIVNDCFFVDSFLVDEYNGDTENASIVTIYKTNASTDDFLRNIGIKPHEVQRISDTTILLTAAQLGIMKMNAPYMISMQVKDLADFTFEEESSSPYKMASIPDPTNEPIVGVIDTHFSTDVYFSKWVDYKNMMSPDIQIDSGDYEHGTAVSSIIVDGCSSNPDLEDGCGRFRVRHFGVCKKGRFSSTSIIRSIREIIAQNTDIKVWNLSLGSPMEVSQNFISPEAAELDRLQVEYDVIFIVAGTNKPLGCTLDHMLLGAPADSLNSIVVNSVTKDNMPASYTRTGPVLSFFRKPDVCYYGGDKGDDNISVCKPYGEGHVVGTSYAAPWVTRKVAYLIYKMGLSRDVAKALVIDASARWDCGCDTLRTMGFGIVPKNINEILQSRDDEIRFIIRGETDAYETYAYDIPVPYVENKYPFIARATLCYFPECSRDQGVDYTNTEMDLYFGRVKKGSGGVVCVASIDKNNQTSANDGNYPDEAEARIQFRKWDNVKHISESVDKRFVRRKAYGENPMWGLRITTKERLSTRRKSKLGFAVVVTLREMFGNNRYADFVKQCQFHGWIVNELDIQVALDIQAVGEQQLTFDFD